MAAEDAAGPAEDDRPELLIKLQERKVRHKQRNILHRAAIVILGILIVLAGIVMSGPGRARARHRHDHRRDSGFLALEFDWAERWLERVILWGDRAAERAEQHDHEAARRRRDRDGRGDRRLRRGGDPLGHPADARPLGIRRPRTPGSGHRVSARDSCSRSSTRRILPVSVFGRSSTNSISRG